MKRNERWGISQMAVNKNESNRAIEVKRRSGDSGKYGVECNGANTASQNVGGATRPSTTPLPGGDPVRGRLKILANYSKNRIEA